MGEPKVTLSHFLKMRSNEIASLLMPSCFLVVQKVNQAMIGWILAMAFLAFEVHEVNSARAAHLQKLLSALAFLLV
jgi:hypothetical protein